MGISFTTQEIRVIVITVKNYYRNYSGPLSPLKGKGE